MRSSGIFLHKFTVPGYDENCKHSRLELISTIWLKRWSRHSSMISVKTNTTNTETKVVLENQHKCLNHLSPAPRAPVKIITQIPWPIGAVTTS